ncbi:unnamed protein product [Eretmochelys imbricata]
MAEKDTKKRSPRLCCTCSVSPTKGCKRKGLCLVHSSFLSASGTGKDSLCSPYLPQEFPTDGARSSSSDHFRLLAAAASSVTCLGRLLWQNISQKIRGIEKLTENDSQMSGLTQTTLTLWSAMPPLPG